MDYGYRVTMVAGERQSWPAWTFVGTPIRSPVDVRASPGVRKVSLSWANRSTAATGIAVLRGRGADDHFLTPVAQLPPTATSYEDTGLGVDWYTYAVEVQVGEDRAASESATVLTLPDSPNLSLVRSFPGVPSANLARRGRQGGLVLGGGDLFGWWDPVVRIPSGGAWTEYYPPEAASWASPYFLLDNVDRPQFMYLRGPNLNGQPYDVVHAWFDGAALRFEPIANRKMATSNSSSLSFAIDSAGKMHAFWAFLREGSWKTEFEYATNSSGTWVIEKLPDIALPPGGIDSVLLSLDRDGGLHAVVNRFVGLELVERAAGGSWTWETISTNDGTGEDQHFLGTSVACVSPAAGDVRVFFIVTKSGNRVRELVEARKANGAWLAPQIVSAAPNSGGLDNLQIAVRADGLRQAARINSNDGVLVYVDDGSGWQRTVLGPVWGRESTLGFTPDGRLYMVEHAPSPMNWVLYEEPPSP